MFDSLFPKHWTTLQRLMWLKTNALARAVYEIVTGNPVSFTAKAAPLRQLKVAFSPVQNLNGYDSPWPAGGGKNKCPTPIEDNVVYRNGGHLFSIAFNNGVMTWEITGTASTYFMLKAFTITQDHVGKTYTMSFSSTPEIDMSSTASCLRLWDSATQTRTNLNSRTVTITADMVGQDLCLAFYKSGTGTFVISNCQLEEGQTATSYAPYSNICPISGWSSLTVEQRGVNLLDYSTQIDGYRLNASGELVSSTNNAVSDYIRVAPSTEYYFRSLIGSNAGYALAEYDETKALVKAQTFYGAGFVSKAVTTQATTAFVRVCFSKIHAIDPAVNYPATATEYVPYNPLSRSISISLGSTVYSGYVDVVTGVGEIDKAIIDMSEMRWTLSYDLETWQDFRSSDINSAVVKPATDKTDPNMECSCFEPVYRRAQAVDGQINTIGLSAGGNVVVLVTAGAYADATAFKTAMTGQKICYPLATPIPISLTPQEVESLAGDNTMWSNANQPITVEYRKN